MKKDQEPLSAAIALYYDGFNTPRITAKGEGDLADKIIAIAEENGVPLHQDALLTYSLAQLELGQEIPEELYITIAKIVAFVYYLQGKQPDANSLL